MRGSALDGEVIVYTATEAAGEVVGRGATRPWDS